MSLFTRHGGVRAQPQIPWKRKSAPRVSSVVVGCPKRRPLMEEIRPRILRRESPKTARGLWLKSKASVMLLARTSVVPRLPSAHVDFDELHGGCRTRIGCARRTLFWHRARRPASARACRALDSRAAAGARDRRGRPNRPRRRRSPTCSSTGSCRSRSLPARSTTVRYPASSPGGRSC